jgi:hypothetical protein
VEQPKEPVGPSPFADPDTVQASLVTPPDFAYPAQPPMGVGHLMLWMAGSGVLLMLYRGVFEFPDSSLSPTWVRPYQFVIATISSFVGGISIASLILAAYRPVTRGVSFPCQPGHWLMVAQGFVTVIHFLGLVLIKAISDTSELSVTFNFLSSIAAHGICSVLFILICIRLRDALHWKLFFVVAAGAQALLTMAFLGMWSTRFLNARFTSLEFQLSSSVLTLVPILLLILTVIIAAIDIRYRRQRDWLHWVGVAVQAASLLISVGAHLCVTILQRLFE